MSVGEPSCATCAWRKGDYCELCKISCASARSYWIKEPCNRNWSGYVFRPIEETLPPAPVPAKPAKPVLPRALRILWKIVRWSRF